MIKIERAREFAKERHKDQVDDYGLPYFEAHLEQVVNILKQITDDEDVMCAGYLHDTIEDTETTFEELQINFGFKVAKLVMEVTHEGQADHYGYYFPRLESKRGIMIKFADRLSNLSRMKCWSQDRQKHYLKKSVFWKTGQRYKNEK